MASTKRDFGDGFGLSFLDVLCCGLGAAILLLLIVKHESPGLDDSDWQLMLQPEVKRLESDAAEVRSSIELSDSVLKSLKYRFDAITQENSEDLAKLSQQEKKLVELKTRLAGESAKLAEISRLNERINDDQKAIPRQEFEARGLNFGALSGVQLGGQDKVVILLDTSASMIHWSLVEIIRTQASGPNAIRAAFKWRQAQTIGALAYSSIDTGQRFKFLTYSEVVVDADSRKIEKGELRWDMKDEKVGPENLKNLAQLPAGGTNLRSALEAVSRLVPKPNRILLITDGLPNNIRNRGELKGCPRDRKGVTRVSGECRISVSLKSIEKLSTKLSKVPIDVILLPLEGDSDAVRFYSLLTGISSGRLVTPSVDWLVGS